ncbi:MAG TPA: cytidylate kinase-like family protein [Syntrophales bacterium]|nr:cytidylate kinase-like family protein [Syntrophales bacterium]
MGTNPHRAITLSRQMGSGGSYIGYLAARELGFKFIDREVLRQAADHLGTEVSQLEHQDERSSGLIEKLIRGFFLGAPEAATTAHHLKRPVYDRDLFSLECRIMNEIAERYSAVIIGRGGFHALRKRPEGSVIRVFIHAPLEFRVQRVMKARNIVDAAEARSIIEESDRRRARFIRDMVGVEWTDAKNYHLCIDSSVAGFPRSVEMIAGLVGPSA